MTKPLPASPLSLPGRPDYAGFAYGPVGAIRHDVYWKGNDGRPGVLVMHELPGLAPATLKLADRLVQENYRVFLPHMFGQAMDSSTATASLKNYARLCVSAEFAKLDGNVTAPITDWLRALARDISAWCNDGRVGAIGMCLTGGFVIPLILEPLVTAPVTSQPAIPLPARILSRKKTREAINVADADVTRAAARAKNDNVTLLGLRFSSDWKCPQDRFDRLKRDFDTSFDPHVYATPDERFKLKRSAHSVLTYAYDPTQDPAHPSQRAMQEVLKLFARAL